MTSPLRNILVGIGRRPDSPTLAAAAALARRENARLTLLAAVVKPSPLFWLSPIALPYDPVHAPEEECAARLRAAVAGLPADVPVTTLLRREPAARALLEELRTGAHDLAAVGGGRVARALLKRSPVPVLVVAEGAPACPKGESSS